MNANSVTHNPAEGRFEITVEGRKAVLQYRRSDNSMRLIHTEVPEPLRGRGLANQLARAALDYAQFHQLKVIAICPFIKSYLEKHPQSAG
jgi:uncharacterized protein